MGAARPSELLETPYWDALVACAELKPLECERFQIQLQKMKKQAEDGSDDETESHGTPMRVKRSIFWQGQSRGRPRRVVFIRHGQSEANVNRDITMAVPDHELHLTQTGREQALEAGLRVKSMVGSEDAKFVVSPYVRTRETLNGILQAWEGELEDFRSKLSVRSDVRIREQEYGNFDRDDMSELHKEKSSFGAFYYRFPDGESPADCYDRASIFLESLYRSWEDNSCHNYMIVSHGLMILVCLMRLLRIPVEEFEQLCSLENCEFVVLERPENDPMYSISYTWTSGKEKNMAGLRKKEKEKCRPPAKIWNGNPDAEMLTSQPTPARLETLERRRSSGHCSPFSVPDSHSAYGGSPQTVRHQDL